MDFKPKQATNKSYMGKTERLCACKSKGEKIRVV